MQKEHLRSLAFVAAVAVVSSAITSTVISSRSVHAATSQKDSDSLLSGLPAATITPPFLTKEQLLTKGQDNDKVEITNLIYTYGFYHDSGNGPGVTSLFTKDGAVEGFWNNNGNVLVGRGCLSRGVQIGRAASVDAAGNTAKPGKT